jgi:hypothetical protein
VEDLAMPDKKPAAPLKLGDWVKIRHSGFKRARIVELRGPLGPNGAQIYRVRVRAKPKPIYIELREDQLELLPPEKKPAEPLNPGDLVKIRHSGFKRARIVELREPLAPDGRQVYRVRVQGTKEPVYIELPENLVELIPAEK